MGRPVMTRSIKRTRQWNAGNENYAQPGIASIASCDAHESRRATGDPKPPTTSSVAKRRPKRKRARA